MFLFRALTHSDVFLHAVSHFAALRNDPYIAVMALIGFFCLLVAFLANSATLTLLTGDRVFSFWASMLFALMAQLDLASSWENSWTTPYDAPSLMFFALGLYLIVSRRWWLYYLAFPVAVLNREGACMITVTFAVWEWVRLVQNGKPVRSRMQWILPHAALQLAIWIAIKAALSHYFAHNPVEPASHGHGLFITHFAFNLRELFKPQQWPILASICGFTLPFLWLQRRWIRCAPLAAAIAVVLPLTFVAFLIVGLIIEIRIFSDWIALVSPALALILFNRFRPVPTPPDHEI
jgi:hypothetical protein